MGGNHSKVRKYVESGDEESCLKLFEDNSQLLKNFNANESMNELHESALHLCCKSSMPCLVKTLLYECNANPNRRNVFNQTALHLVCQIPVPNDEPTNDVIEIQSEEDINEKRAKCLQLILEWNKVCKTNKSKKVIETIDINGLDRNGNTSLHLAATNGLLNCVQILERNNCDLFIENESGDTACDLAVKYCRLDVLQYLEFKMVFSHKSNAVLTNQSNIYNLKEEYSSLKWHDLEEAKNQLIVETSNMLNIPLSSSEVLLRSFDWSEEAVIDHWFNDSENSVKESHLNSIKDNKTVAEVWDPIEDISGQQSLKQFCEICSLDLGPNGAIGAKCGHQFCSNCWRTYLEMKIGSGGTFAITCPAFNCSDLVTTEMIEKVVSPELTDRFVRNDIEAFIESNPNIQWCPHPGCNKAVYLPKSQLSMNESYIWANLPPILSVSHAVDCGSGHYFCWECRREAHSPCDCKLWNDWIIKTSDIRAEELKHTYSRTEDAANCLWLVRNAKQCPRCKTYIQKMEGCNHLRCSKCKYDFCWVCLESWKKHNSGTGGYFRCNRSEAAQRAEQNLCLLKRVAESQTCEMKELKKFVFHYTKYKFNNISKESETTLMERTNDKQKEFFNYSIELLKDNHNSERVTKEDNFLFTAAIEVIRSRKVLCGSAVYGYYLEDYGYNKAIFDHLEANLNICCNRLSDVINCDFLKKSRNFIINFTNRVKTRRIELLSAVAKGLIPPETPPGLNKHKGRQCLPGVLALDSMENLCNPCDENDKSLINEAIISSLSELNDENSWIQDRNGKHNNLFAIYDWPDDYNVDYTQQTNDNKLNEELAQNSKSCESDPKICFNPFCTKPKVQNPRTGERHDFCSLKCKYLTEDRNRNSFEDNMEMDYEYDSSMDLLLAIEMSKLSFEEEKQRQSDTNSMESIEDNRDLTEENNNENPFELFVENIKVDPNIKDSSTKTAVMFFLKSSFNDRIDDKNLNPLPNDLKVDKQLFSGFQ